MGELIWAFERPKFTAKKHIIKMRDMNSSADLMNRFERDIPLITGLGNFLLLMQDLKWQRYIISEKKKSLILAATGKIWGKISLKI